MLWDDFIGLNNPKGEFILYMLESCFHLLQSILMNKFVWYRTKLQQPPTDNTCTEQYILAGTNQQNGAFVIAFQNDRYDLC